MRMRSAVASVRAIAVTLGTLSILVGAACRGRDRPQDAATTPGSATGPMAPAPSAPPESPCSTLQRAQRAALARWPACPEDPSGMPRLTPNDWLMGSCLPTRHGAWGLVAAAPSGSSCWDGSSNVHAAHVRDGILTEGAPIVACRHFDDARVFDFDGDGEEELLLGGHPDVRSDIIEMHGDPLPCGLVLREGSGSIEGLVMDVPILGFEDVDGDGRPDALTGRSMSGSDGDVTAWTFVGQRGVAHSQPGGKFSTTDGAAVAYARRQCARSKLESASAPELYAAALCARLGGGSVASIKARYERRCHALRSGAEQMASPPGAERNLYDHGVSLRAVCRVHNDSGADSVHGMPKRIEAELVAMQPLP